ncbi:MAG: hypothetical protein U0Q20_09855 [Mycobacterium sp.]|nr:hypothetical protein [Mycobacterium sp.]
MTAWESARAVADAVLYEGYLLYPYRATSDRNRSRWQFGVLGPPGAADAGLGEDDRMSAQFLTRDATTLDLTVRFLQLQHRRAERRTPGGGYVPVAELVTATGSLLAWDEAVECELHCGPVDLASEGTCMFPVTVAAGVDVEDLDGGRLVRERRPVHGELAVSVDTDPPVQRITVTLRNTGPPAISKDDATARSMIGTHLIGSTDGVFVSLLEPPDDAADDAARCEQHRCFPVLAGPPECEDLLLISPIILYDHPQIAEQSQGALYDATEIDEILTLRVMTMTDEEKAQARATDPLAARIIEQCDGMTAEAMLDLHGVLRDQSGLIPDVPDGVDWWDPSADTAVAPESDGVLVAGVRIARGSRVRLRPSRRADAQDMFVAGRTARVASVHADVDGGQYVGVVIDDDPAADLHDSYGRYLYFSPDEIEPLPVGP